MNTQRDDEAYKAGERELVHGLCRWALSIGLAAAIGVLVGASLICLLANRLL